MTCELAGCTNAATLVQPYGAAQADGTVAPVNLNVCVCHDLTFGIDSGLLPDHVRPAHVNPAHMRPSTPGRVAPGR